MARNSLMYATWLIDAGDWAMIHCIQIQSHMRNTTHSFVRHASAQHTEPRCNHTAPHCNTLQHTATNCNTLPHSATLWHTLPHSTTRCHALQHTATPRQAATLSRKGCENVFSHLDETIVSHLHVKRSSIVLHSVRCCTEQRQAATLSRKGREMAHSFVWHSYVWPDYPRVWRDSSICVHMDVAISRKGENVFPHLVLFTCSSFHV